MITDKSTILSAVRMVCAAALLTIAGASVLKAREPEPPSTCTPGAHLACVTDAHTKHLEYQCIGTGGECATCCASSGDFCIKFATEVADFKDVNCNL